MASIVARQDASSGMWAFSEMLEQFYLVVLLYLLWPMLFNLAGRFLRQRGTPTAKGCSRLPVGSYLRSRQSAPQICPAMVPGWMVEGIPAVSAPQLCPATVPGWVGGSTVQGRILRYWIKPLLSAMRSYRCIASLFVSWVNHQTREAPRSSARA
jgi:hypothetical protein